MDLENPFSKWEVVQSLKENPLKNSFTNAPCYMAFDPNAAVAYRGFPLSVWKMGEKKAAFRHEKINTKQTTMT